MSKNRFHSLFFQPNFRSINITSETNILFLLFRSVQQQPFIIKIFLK